MSAEIRALMGRHRVTQTALAEYLGMSQSALSERLNGHVPWDIDDLVGIADRFEINPADLVAPIFLVRSTFTQVVTEVQYSGQMELFGHEGATVSRSLELVKV